ncbi:hypothetical protein MASR2M15_27250 [Anaerolineales bacterium]
MKKNKLSLFYALLLSAATAAPLMAMLYLADRFFGLAFLPFDFFDWLARMLPGSLLTFGIDSMVDTIIAFNLGETSSAAKTAEQLLGLVSFFIVITLIGGIVIYILSRLEEKQRIVAGMVMGAIAVIPLVLISHEVNQSSTVDPLLNSIWFMALFAVWGWVLAWVVNATLIAPETAQTEAEMGLDRRQFIIRLGSASAVLTIAGAGLGALLGSGSNDPVEIVVDTTTDTMSDTAQNLPNKSAILKPAAGTRPEYTPLDQHYRIDISARPPVIEPETWRLKINGLVENLTELSLAELQSDFESVDQFVTLSCISNRLGGDLISTTKWTGIPFSKIMTLVKPEAEAGAVLIRGADGFDEFVRLETLTSDDRIMLVYAWDDQPLKQKHGFPLRIYIPNLYGMKQPKWIESMEFVSEWGEGFWVRRGWDKDATINATSVIDTVAVDSIYKQDDQYVVPIGGIAYAGPRGIKSVELRVDQGEWQTAALRQPISDTTWVIWRFDWPFTGGNHNFEVRCTEGDGTLQSEVARGTRPSGATGIDSMESRLPDPDSIKA